MRRLLILLATVAVALPAQPPAKKAAPRTVELAAPLSPYAAVKVAVVPVQFFSADSSGFVATPAMAMRVAFDSLLSVALDEHGLKGTWATPADVLRSAKRNPTYIGDARNLGAYSVRLGVNKETQIADPLAGNLRRIAALHDARYLLMPVELHVDATKSGGQLSVLLLLIDARLNVPLWQADLMGERAAVYSPAMLQKLATRVAELVVAP